MLETNLNYLFHKAVLQNGEKIAFKDEKKLITYNELRNEVNKVMNFLVEIGIKQKDRVAIWMENSIDYVVVDLAIMNLGAVRVPLNTFLNQDEVKYRLIDSEAKMIICDQKLLDITLEICGETNLEITIMSSESEKVYCLQKVLKEGSKKELQVEIKEDDISLIMYTGGTTGRSKGVTHNHKSIIAIIYSQIVEMEIGRGETILHVAPLPHAAGFLVMSGFLRGSTQIINKGFDPVKFCETVQREKINFTFLVPTMIYVLLDLPSIDQYDFSSLKTLIYGAAPMAPNRIRDAIAIFGPVLTQVYSQAEVANQTTVLTKEDHLYGIEYNEKVLSSCGKSIIMSQVSIIDEDGNECESGKVGEIITKGPHLMKGYWNLEEETNKTIIDGWLYTGDMAYQDEQGYFYLVDRKKDMIISGGFNVYTTAVEKVIFEHPGVNQVTVIGVPDAKWGEAIKAFIVLIDSEVTEQVIINFCKLKLAKYEVPKYIEFVEKLPLTPYGKIDKKELRKPYWMATGRNI